MNEFPCPNNCGVPPFGSEELRDLHVREFCRPSQDDVREASVPIQTAKLDVETHAEFLYPKPIQGYRIESRVRRKIERIIQESETGASVNLLTIGPSGSGKTTLAYHIAGLLGRPLAKINMQMISEASQLYGFREANPVEGTTYRLGQFPIAISKEGCVVLLDDVAHTHDRTITNALLPALDFTRALWLDYLGEWIKVAPKVIIIGTGNQGHQYGGAMKLDRAIVSRFESKIYMGHPPESVVVDVLTERTGVGSQDAQRLARFAAQLRDSRSQIEVDMRGLLAAAKDMAYGASYFEAIVYTLLGDLDPQKREELTFAIHDGMSEQENLQASAETRWEEWR